MISFDEALALVGATARPLGTEQVPLKAAEGRVLAEPVCARVSSPPANVSAMDGYAVREADLASLPASLSVIGKSFAGRGFEGSTGETGCIRIFTGAPVPPGFDRVVMQEDVTREGALASFSKLGEGRHIRAEGSDFKAGEVLLNVGTLLGARTLVAAAAADVGEVSVARRPRVTLVATGDELAEPGTAAGQPGRIPESVSFGVAALARQAGAQFAGSHRLGDDLYTLRDAVPELLDAADVVVVTGGASVGERDFAKAMFEEAGLELIFSKVAIKPGKPVWLGRAGERLVMGLPGNPSSALVTARLLLVPLLHGLTGHKAALNWRHMPLAMPLEGAGGRETFSRGFDKGGEVHLVTHQDSSAQRALAEASLLVRRKPGSDRLERGSLVSILDF